MLIGEQDRKRGVLGDEQGSSGSQRAGTCGKSEAIAGEEESEGTGTDTDEMGNPPELVVDIDLPDGRGRSVLCVGGRGELDDAAAVMLAQVLQVQGAEVSRASFADLEPSRIRDLTLEAGTVVVSFLNSESVRHARFVIRRLKRLRPALRVGVVFWSASNVAQDDLNADFVANTMNDAVIGALADAPPKSLKLPSKRLVRYPVRKTPRPAQAPSSG